MKVFVWYYPQPADLTTPAAAEAVTRKLRKLHAAGVYYMVDEAQVNTDPQPWRLLQERLRGAGAEVQLGFLPFSDPPEPTPEMLRRRYSYRADGRTEYRGLCPAWPENRLLALHRALQLCELLQPTALHLDYLRYTFANNAGFGEDLEWEEGGKWLDTYHRCTCALCQTERLELLGREPNDWDRHHPGYLFKRLGQRAQHVEEVLLGLRRLCQGRGMRLTCAVRVLYLSRALVEGQDWVRWGKLGLLDSLAPMNYSSSVAVVERRLRENRRLLQHIQVEQLEGLARRSSAGETPLEVLAEQMLKVTALGAQGVSLFHLGALTEEECETLGALADN